MSERRDLLEQLAVYRDLSQAERDAVREQLAGDPAAADLLAGYREMDRKLAALPDPAPDPALAAGFRQALAEEARERPSPFAWLGRAPAVAGQVAAVALLLILVLGAGWLFREQFRTPAAGGPLLQGTPAGDPLTTVSGLEPIPWQLVEIEGESAQTRMLGLALGVRESRGAPRTFEATGFCTVFKGTVDLTAERIFAVEEQPLPERCAAGFAVRDEVIGRALLEATALYRAGQWLAVADESGAVRLLYGPSQPAVEPALVPSNWTLTELRGAPPLAGTEITLEIDAGYLGGSAGCNTYTGQIHQFADGEVHLGYFLVAEVGCSQPARILEQERQFTDLFQNEVAGYRRQRGELLLLDPAGETLMRFRAAAPSPTGTPTPAGSFPGPTPTPAVRVEPDAPFAPFRDYMARWPEQTGMAHGALRAGMKAYLAQIGGIEALSDDPARLADLESRLRPAVPVWGEHALALMDLYPGGGDELLVAALPFVDVYTRDEAGILHARGVAQPRLLPVANGWPVQVRRIDMTGEGDLALFIAYESLGEVDRAAEGVIAYLDFATGRATELWRGYVPELAALPDAVEPLQILVEDGLPLPATTCPAVGAFTRSLLPGDGGQRLPRRDVYVWNGAGYVPLLTERAEPATQRQYANVAEAHLRAGDFAEALARYRRLAAGESGLPAGAGEPDWRTLAALRAGQIHALLGERVAAEEILRQAQLSSTQLGRAAGIFGEAYAGSGDVVAAWAALLADGELLQALVAGQNGLAGGPGDPLALFYPGMALASALSDLTPADLDEEAIPDLLGRWQAAGLAVGSGRLVDVDGDGALEAIYAQPVPSVEQAHYVQISLLDHGPQGWFAFPLGQLPGPFEPLPAPVPGPDGTQLILVGGVYAQWDGQQLRYTQGEQAGYALWLPATRPDQACLLPAPQRQEFAWEWQEPPTPTPTRVRPTLSPLELTATAEFATYAATRATPTPFPFPEGYPAVVTPTPWDQDGMPTPLPTPTPFPYLGSPGPPEPSPTPG